MKKIRCSFRCSILVLVLIVGSCEKDENEVMNSRANDTESHRHGENCMECHIDGGKGEGIFTVAGSLYAEDLITPFTSGKVELYGDPVTGIVRSLEVDGRGNFYTTEPIDFSGGLHTRVVGDTILEMKGLITQGGCNGCHGSSAPRLWLK